MCRYPEPPDDVVNRKLSYGMRKIQEATLKMGAVFAIFIVIVVFYAIYVSI